MAVTMVSTDEKFMRQCLALGRAAAEAGEVPVGAIVVLDGIAIGQGREASRSSLDVTAHAEVVAIRDAALASGMVDLGGSTLYTNVEPCVLCSYAIRRSAFDRVVIGMPTAALGGATSRYRILTDHLPTCSAPPALVQGVLLDECTALMDRHRDAGGDQVEKRRSR